MTMPLKNPYCTLLDVQSEAANDEDEDVDQFQAEINAASRWIDGYCRRDFLFHDHTTNPLVVKNDWPAANVIFLPIPIITLTKIVVDGLELDATQYIFENSWPRSTSQIKRSGRWVKPAKYGSLSLPPKIELYGTFGYAPALTNPDTTPSPALPQEIITMCRVLAAIRSGKVKREFTAPDGSRQVATVRNLPPDILNTLNRYRQQVI